MEYLYTNGQGRPVTNFKEDTIENVRWVGLNRYTNAIPREAYKFVDKMDYHSPEAAKDELGRYKEMEWANQPDWHSLEYHWRPYIPIRAPESLSPPWYLQIDRPAVINTFGGPDRFIVERKTAEDFTRDLWKIRDWVTEIANSEDFGSGPIPSRFDTNLLVEVHDSIDSATSAVAGAKRAMVDGLGFLNWWRACLPHRAHWLSNESTEEFDKLNIRKYEKRGILVNLSRDWMQINLPAWVAHEVPIFYPWTYKEELDERFGRLNPSVWEAYRRVVWDTTFPNTTPLTASIPEWEAKYSYLAKYDGYLQEIEKDRDIGDDATDYVNVQKCYITDFRSWRRREVEDPDRQRTYVYAFAFYLSEEEGDRVATYVRWRPRREDSPIRHDPFDLEGEEHFNVVNDQESMMEIRELYKADYAPKLGELIEEVTGLVIRSPFTGLDARARFTEEFETNIAMEEEAARVTSLVDSADDYQTAPALQSRIASPGLGPNPLMEKETSPESETDKMDVDDYSPFPRGRSRARSPVWSSHSSRGEPRSPSSAPKGYQSDWARRLQRDAESRRNRSRSLSPASALASHYPQSAKHEVDRSAFVRALKQWGWKFTYPEDPSKFPKADWHPQTITHGHLLVDTIPSQFRMRFWAATSDDNPSILDILEQAVTRGIKFSIGWKQEDLASLRPKAITTVDRKLAPAAHQPGVSGPALNPSLRGAALKDSYEALLESVLKAPNAGAFIAEGGAASWIARQYGGTEIIAKFIGGPSLLVTIHNKGRTDSKDSNPLYIHEESVTQAQLDALHGFIPGGNPDLHLSLYPDNDLMARYSDHWKGEWHAGLEFLFNLVAKEIDVGAPLLRTRVEWKNFFKRCNSGRYGPTPERVVDEADWAEAKKKISDAFPTSWHKKPLGHIVLPERYVPIAAKK